MKVIIDTISRCIGVLRENKKDIPKEVYDLYYDLMGCEIDLKEGNYKPIKKTNAKKNKPRPNR